MIDQLLKNAVEKNASDIHLTVGKPPILRINGRLIEQVEFNKVLPHDTEDIAIKLIPPEKYDQLMEMGEVDFAYPVHGLGRFRASAFKQRGSISLVLRLINNRIPTLEELEMPNILGELAMRKSGLVLITGPTGSGKSTTLAAMINKINTEQSLHIITLEDPIEYMHAHKNSIINQREIGSDLHNFANGLRSALRQDPDVIMVGEMRDLETISIAITAAETGHLVLGTLHTNSTPQTIERIIDVFPPYHQPQIRVQLADTLQGIVTQQLFPRIDRNGRVAALEILIATPAIRNLIRENKTYQIISNLQTGVKYGMQTLENSMKSLMLQGKIAQYTI
jgi:twitching motility protein PilT